MPTVLAYHEVTDLDHWLSSPKREEFFGPLGITNVRTFVDPQGTKEPVRVTYSDGFDGLPVPSPDGRQLAWTSARSGGSAGQLFLAQWNHEHALAAIKNAPPRKPSRK